ncbi:DMT family transporter [Paeniglutamicibacter sp. R2-26]|uniref:DMT family transporter n=1 Tax=Paeniglutamicibacter sp. R2-26 TaxID=3144417 RepID=UPI003EE71F8B
MNRGRLLAIGAVTVTSVLWGTTGTAATFAPAAGPLAIGAAALGIGGILQALIAVPALLAHRSLLRANLPLVALGALAVAIYPLAFYSSMHLAGVALGTVVSLASAPLASGLLERFVQRTPLGTWWMVAAGLGITGSVLLCLSKMGGGSGDAGNTLAGMALGLVAGATYACYSWCARRLMDRGVERSASMGAVFGAGGLLLLPVLVVTGAPLLASQQAFAVATYMALVPMFLGYVLFGYGLARLGAGTATTITLSEPAVAALLAVLVVGETLGPLGWVGLAVIGAALAVLALAPAQAAAPEAMPRRRGVQPVSVAPTGSRTLGS